MRELKVGGRIAIGCACIIAVAVINIFVATSLTRSARQSAAEVNALRAPTALTSLRLSGAVIGSANAVRGYVITRNPALHEQWTAEWRIIDSDAAALDQLSPRFTDGDNRARWTEVRNLLPRLKAAQSEVLATAGAGDSAAAAAGLQTQVLPLFNRIQAALVGADGASGMAGSQATLLSADLARATALIARADLALLAGGVLMLALGALVALITTRAIALPLAQLTQVLRVMADGRFDVHVPATSRRDEIGDVARAAEIFKQNGTERDRLAQEAAQFQAELDRKLKETEAAFEAAGRDQKRMVELMARDLAQLAQGDLSVRLQEPVAPEYQALKDDFNAAAESLEQAIQTIAMAASGIGSGSEEIARASEDLSKRTAQQAASLEETAAALEQITATVRKTASGAQNASDAVATARADAVRSGEIVSQAVGAMNVIEQSSARISQIIGVIDEIAFQTNLLALNAGVEAARAGDSGKGFAVVASEVRALAQRSAEAAKEIEGLISASAAQVGEGVSLVRQTGEALHRIVDQVAGISELVAEISGSAQEQAQGLEQVNTAVNQMDQVVQQNAAMVEQSTAATASLKGETGALTQLVNRFRVRQAARTRPAAADQPGKPAPVVHMRQTDGALALKPDWKEF